VFGSWKRIQTIEKENNAPYTLSPEVIFNCSAYFFSFIFSLLSLSLLLIIFPLALDLIFVVTVAICAALMGLGFFVRN